MSAPPRPPSISRWNVANRFQRRKLLIAINCLAGLSIFFFGMMGGVNNAKAYIDTMGFGYVDPATGDPIITRTILQGGIVSVYYLGTLFGALLGGWVGEKVGRIKTIAIASIWAVIGAALQTSAQNSNWMICARVVNGIGTGMLNAIVPVWATETASHTSRGQFIAIEFTLNIFGVVVAYWLEFGLSYIDNGTTQFRWRFPVAFQIIPLFALFIAVWFFPESPRWLVKAGRDDEARWILSRLRGEELISDKNADGGERPTDAGSHNANATGEKPAKGAVGSRHHENAPMTKAHAEFLDIKNVHEAEESGTYPTSYVSMLLGTGSGTLHIGRRVQLVIWLQIMQEWVGIAGVTVYAPTIFRLAGFDAKKSQWLSGLNNIFYMFSTLVCVFTLDRIGRRWTLYWGSVVQGIAMFIAGGLSGVTTAASAAGDTARANSFGAGSAAMIFIFTSAFGATWLTVPWLYPAEIFPLAVRAKGNAWGVVGWSIGNGWLTLLCPVMFNNINEKTLYIFGIANAVSIPMVWALYPETNQRTLEEVDLLFAAPTPWNWDAERTFARLKAEHPELVNANQDPAAHARAMANVDARRDSDPATIRA